MDATVNINGVLSRGEHALISVFDHAFLYGDGVYETLRTYDRRPFLFEPHLDRLRAQQGSDRQRARRPRVIVELPELRR